MGGGRSTIWLAQHFPNTVVIAYVENLNLPLMRDEKIPTNLTLCDDKNFKILANPENNKEALIIDSSETVFAKGEFLFAIGLRDDSDYLKDVSPKNVTVYPYSKKEEWIAPEGLPNGSLIEATQRWARVTGNMDWTYEPHAFYKDAFENFIDQFRASGGACLPNNFFDEVRHRVNAYYGPGGAPNLQETKKLYRESLLSVYGGVSDEFKNQWGIMDAEITKHSEILENRSEVRQNRR